MRSASVVALRKRARCGRTCLSVRRCKRQFAVRPVRTFTPRQVAALCEHSLCGRDVDSSADEFLAPAALRMAQDRREPCGFERIQTRRLLAEVGAGSGARAADARTPLDGVQK